jgi:phosphoadenosine phosphosulfate reductase
MSALNPLPFPNIEAIASTVNRAFLLNLRYGDLDAKAVLDAAIHEVFPGRVALVSSFGAESAVLLHMAAAVDRDLPVIFLDTGKLFGETLRYRDALVARLGLRDVRTVNPATPAIAAEDADGFLFHRDPDRCCHLRKVAPLARTLEGFEAWITGRKAFHGATRADLPVFDSDGARVKINPLAAWDRPAVDAYFACHDLPRHPLQADGFLSIGCYTCTDRVAAGEDARAGRWRGRDKTECGIHKQRRAS